jgi:lycopene cyclase domain-containing protein
MLEYLSLMLIFTVPFIAFAVHRRRITALGKAAAMGLVIGVPWDTISAGYFYTWSWRRTALLGVYIGPLPVEEYLFMMLVPMMLIGARSSSGLTSTFALHAKKRRTSLRYRI